MPGEDLSRRTNILCLEQFSSLGGGQLCLLDLLPGLVNRGWQAMVAVPGEGPFSAAVRALGIPVTALRESAYKNKRSRGRFAEYSFDLQSAARAILRMARTHRADLLYVNGTRLFPPAALIGRLLSIPVILHCHNRLLERTAIRLVGNSLRFARGHLISCCRSTAIPLSSYIHSDHFSVIYNGIAGFPQRKPAASVPRTIGIVGRIERDKGQLEFVRAARLIRDQFPNVRFFIIGAPLFRGSEYLERVKLAGQGLPVEFAGWQNDIGAVLSNLDLLVVPSTQVDSTPRVILEAFSAGVPVVAFPSGGIPEILKDDETGFLTTASTPQALADRIASVLMMPHTQLNSTIRRARQSWQEHFTLDRYQQQVTRVIGEVLSGAKQKPAGTLDNGRQKSAKVMPGTGQNQAIIR